MELFNRYIFETDQEEIKKMKHDDIDFENGQFGINRFMSFEDFYNFLLENKVETELVQTARKYLVSLWSVWQLTSFTNAPRHASLDAKKDLIRLNYKANGVTIQFQTFRSKTNHLRVELSCMPSESEQSDETKDCRMICLNPDTAFFFAAFNWMSAQSNNQTEH